MTNLSRTVSQSEFHIESQLGRIADEYADRLGRGEQPDVESYAEQYPDLAETLRHVLPTIEIMCGFTDGDTAVTGEAVPKSLGDYRIREEIGRGGMGVVYRAEQLSLRREVALKVLPFASLLDPRQLQRFRNEALAAAQLDHPHIVSVFGTGCERGVHYYAMQLIQGQTLADVIASRKQETGETTSAKAGDDTPPLAKLSTAQSGRDREWFRTVARMGVQVAEALEYAHLVGIVHRDIKPSNLLIDQAGNVSVTDFGLAQVEADAGLTMTGDLIGTLRYMSPEQSMGRPGLVDLRTDVYSLGITLYELLTLRPAFDGDNRQDLLRRVAFEEPRLPRTIKRSIPVDLETIVLKATAKSPGERYESARELAEDLQRFLGDQPVRARRPTIPQRVGRWSRRNAGIVRAVVSTMLLAWSVASVWIWWEHRQKTAALTASRQATRNEHEQRVAAEHAQEHAQENFERSLEAVDSLLTRVANRRLRDIPHMDQLRRELLEEALRFHQGFIVDSDDPHVHFESGIAYRRVGGIYRRLGRIQEAINSHRRSIDTLSTLDGRFYEAPLAHELARSHEGLAGALAAFEDGENALLNYQRARSHYELAIQHSPADPDYRNHFATMLLNLGVFHYQHARLTEAEAAYSESLDLTRQLAADDPTEAEYESDIGARLHNFALLRSATGDQEEARDLLVEAIRHQQKALESDRGPVLYSEYLRNHIETLALVQEGFGEPAEVHRGFQEAIRIGNTLVADYPDVPRYRTDLAGSYHNFALILTGRNTMQADNDAKENFLHAQHVLEELVSDFPALISNRRMLAQSHRDHGRFLNSRGHREDAREALLHSVARYEEVLEVTRELSDRHETARFLIELGSLQDESDEQASYDRATELAVGCAEESAENASYWSTLAIAQYRSGAYAAAVESFNRSVEIRGNATTSEYLIRAMANHRIGNSAVAQSLYEEVAASLGDRDSVGWEIERLLAEAREVLGIESANVSSSVELDGSSGKHSTP